MPFLHVIDSETNVQRRIPLTKPSFTIGKSPANDLTLDKVAMSRQHCEIVSSNGAYAIRDLGSRNGTYVGGRRITAATPLTDGTRIDLGPVQIIFYAGEMPAAATPAPGDKKAAPGTQLVAREAGPPGRRLVPPELKKKIHERLLMDLDLRHVDLTQHTDEELRQKAEAVVRNAVAVMAAEIPLWLPHEQLIKEVVDEAIGLGPIEDLLADPTIDEIMVNNWDRIYIERKGKLELTDKCFTDNAQVIHIIRRIIAPLGRRIDESSPMVDARLRDGSRVNAIIAPLALTGPTLTIRKFAAEPYTEKDLVERFGTLTTQVVEFLKLIVQYRANILISGGTGSGKTTLLNVVSSFIPRDERIVTIEDAAELKLHQEHVISLEAKPPNIEGKGAIPIRELVRNSLRMRPDRIIVGECRGGEALDMLQAMNTGHDGSLTTIHANSERDSLARVETMVLMAGMELPSRAIREQIASAIDFVAQLLRMTDGTRKLVGLSEITGMEGDVITMQPIYQFEQRGFGEGGRVLGSIKPTGAIPKFVHDLRARGVPVDMTLFQDLSVPPPQPRPMVRH
ncbi:MAG TPA: ATPase, T2SS/T4P/T4SS family [Planctomycetota bacterium]|nr:ATPase, T2SS/T4P/T4SS family [Planctomycetota bacterium]HRR82704.1 ATPase, T2SS/T4P/T4SS family [Planctomycetota bacterium]HRT95417.1 ATPase, T2SS/T4P/T4SS family [Planctomycetota bacterium]